MPRQFTRELCNPLQRKLVPVFLLKLPRVSFGSQSSVVEQLMSHSKEEIGTVNGCDEGAAFVALLRNCSKNEDLQRDINAHRDILQRGLLTQCSDALVTMYAKCGALSEAKDLLNSQKSKSVFAWSALISGYARKNQGQDALDCFEQMQDEGIPPDAVAFISILKACGSISAAAKGQQIHNDIVKLGLLGSDIVLGTALVDMYAKCGAFDKAFRVLEEIPIRSVITWNALISGYIQQGKADQALNCLECMPHDGLSPNVGTFICTLKACGILGATEKGVHIHEEIVRQGLLRENIALGTALVDMYVKCGALETARQVLDELPIRNVISWSALIAGYTQKGKGQEAIDCFEEMQDEGILPNEVTWLCILKACGSIGVLVKAEKIHDEIAKRGLLESNIELGNALVDMYGKCGALVKAQQVLEKLPVRDVVSWSALIAGYAQAGQGDEALNCYESMRSEGLSPNAVTFTCLLNACGSIGAAEKGEAIYDEIARQGLLLHNIVIGNALVDMYAKCGALVKAHKVLEELPIRDVVSWNALVTGYAEQGQGEQAWDCYEQMKLEGLCPDRVTIIGMLKACGCIAADDKGEEILHSDITQQGLLEHDITLGTAVVDMYAKCGDLVKAQRVLKELPARNAVTWNALISGFARHGESKFVVNCLDKMRCDGLLPDETTFSCMLSACSFLGLVDDVQMYLETMTQQHGLKPGVQHYACMFDILGRTGHLDKAELVIENAPFSDTTVWCVLLRACEKWGDVAVGRWAFECALEVERSDATPYALMAAIYTAAGMQEDAEKIEELRMEVEKVPLCQSKNEGG